MDPQFLCTSSGYNCNQISSLNQLLWLLCFNQKQIASMNQEIAYTLNCLVDAINNNNITTGINNQPLTPSINMNMNIDLNLNNINNNNNNNAAYNNDLFNEDASVNKESEAKIAMSPSRKRLIEKYYQNKKDSKKKSKFISLYKSKDKMHRIDCMTRKINSCYYQFLLENTEKYQIDPISLNELKSNLRFTSKQKFQLVNSKYPFFKDLYELFLKSYLFNQLLLSVKCKYDKEYLKLFYNHAHNFLFSYGCMKE